MKFGLAKIVTTATLGIFIAAGAALAMDHSKMNHGSMDMGAGAEKSKRLGVQIQTTKQEKAALEYNLIDNAKQMEKAAAAGAKSSAHDHAAMKSHHLMVYPADAVGKAIGGAKVGFMLTGPDKQVQQMMAMEMEGGYGADVDLKAKGKYEVKMKLVKGTDQVVDTFIYEVK